MASTRKITVTLPIAQVEAIRSLVTTGETNSISEFVQHAVGLALDDIAGWDAMLGEALEATGGELTDQERDWADRILGSGRATKAA